MDFELHPNLAKKDFIVDLPLCKVFLENNANYPWILLVPQKPEINRIMDLSWDDQIQLLREIDLAQQVIWDIFQPTRLNVATIGNKTPQLHLHVIARFENDPAWPGTVWDHPEKKTYDPITLTERISKIKEAFQEKGVKHE